MPNNCSGTASFIVEFRVGASTVWLGHILKSIESGHLISLEHDCKEWYSRDAEWVSLYDFDEYVTVMYAPLTETRSENCQMLWYSLAQLQQELAQRVRPIDLVFVDGPPGYADDNARYAAMPLLKKNLSDECVIILDDVDRPGERRIADEWADLLNYQMELLDGEKGITVLHPKVPAT